MILKETLSSFPDFLRSRGLKGARCGMLCRQVELHLFPALGGADAAVEDLPPGQIRWAIELLRSRGNKDLSSALHHYAAYLVLQGQAVPLDAFQLRSTIRDALHRLIQGSDPTDALDDALGRYLRHLAVDRRLSEPHLISVMHRLRRFIHSVREAGHRTLDTIRAEEVALFREGAAARGVRTFVKDLSDLRCFFSFLLRQGEVREDPTAGIRAKVAARGPRRVLTSEELRALLDAPILELDRLVLSTPSRGKRTLALRDRAVLQLLAETGLRPAELLRITLDDLDLLRGEIRVVGKGSNALPNRERRAFLESEDTLVALRRYLAVRPATHHRALFLSRTHQPLSKDALDGIFLRRARQASIRKRVSPSVLRTTFASRLVARGMDAFALKVLMGHDDIRTTFRLYTSLSIEEVRDVWQRTNPLAPPDDTQGGAA